MTSFKPIHPGEILKEDFMEPFGLSANALAKALGVTPAHINELVREQRGITAETALRPRSVVPSPSPGWGRF